MIVETRKITPAYAKELLKLNIKNRVINHDRVNHYSDQMSRGEWKLTHQGISISPESVIDGQHRLMAIVKSGKTIEMLVCTEPNADNFKIVDTGKNRSARDVMSIAGVKNYSNIGSGVTHYLAFYNNANPVNNSITRNRFSNSDILTTYERDPDFWQELNLQATRCYTKTRIVSIARVIGVTGFLIKKKEYDFDFALDFFRQIVGLNQITNKTIETYRSALVTDAFSIKKLSPGNKLILLKKTWNAYAVGVALDVLKFDRETDKKLQFR